MLKHLEMKKHISQAVWYEEEVKTKTPQEVVQNCVIAIDDGLGDAHKQKKDCEEIRDYEWALGLLRSKRPSLTKEDVMSANTMEELEMLREERRQKGKSQTVRRRKRKSKEDEGHAADIGEEPVQKDPKVTSASSSSRDPRLRDGE